MKINKESEKLTKGYNTFFNQSTIIMKTISYNFTLTPQWLDKLAEQIDAKVLKNTIIAFPKDTADGYLYFTQAISGISVSLLNLNAKTPLTISREISDGNFFIVSYDLSDTDTNINDKDEDVQMSFYEKPNYNITDNNIPHCYEPQLSKKTFVLQLLIDKRLFPDFENHCAKIKSLNDSFAVHNIFNFYGKTDIDSTILLHQLKNKNIHDISFDSFLKGITLKLTANLLKRGTSPYAAKIMSKNKEAVDKTKFYLLSNLHDSFPSIKVLANMAGMSTSKYKIAFKQQNFTSPAKFFIAEKMKLAKKLLTSGNFTTLNTISNDLNYCNSSTLNRRYFQQFNKRPMDDFIRNANLFLQ